MKSGMAFWILTILKGLESFGIVSFPGGVVGVWLPACAGSSIGLQQRGEFMATASEGSCK